MSRNQPGRLVYTSSPLVHTQSDSSLPGTANMLIQPRKQAPAGSEVAPRPPATRLIVKVPSVGVALCGAEVCNADLAVHGARPRPAVRARRRRLPALRQPDALGSLGQHRKCLSPVKLFSRGLGCARSCPWGRSLVRKRGARDGSRIIQICIKIAKGVRVVHTPQLAADQGCRNLLSLRLVISPRVAQTPPLTRPHCCASTAGKVQHCHQACKPVPTPWSSHGVELRLRAPGEWQGH